MRVGRWKEKKEAAKWSRWLVLYVGVSERRELNSRECLERKEAKWTIGRNAGIEEERAEKGLS